MKYKYIKQKMNRLSKMLQHISIRQFNVRLMIHF